MDRHSTGKAPTGTVEAFCLEAKDILKKAFGEDGMHKRNNVLKLKQKTEEAWSKAGASRRTIESFMNSVI